MSQKAGGAAVLLRPNLLFLVFAGIGLGTFLLPQPFRLALLWSALALLALAYRTRYPLDWSFSVPGVARGALLGAIVALPMMVFLAEPLRLFNESLYRTKDTVMLFYQTCFISAPVEECFFRGILQRRLGSSVALALYAGTALVYFLPHAPLLAVLIVFLAMGVLGLMYGYVCERYGLSASVVCHVVVAFVLQVVPSLLAELRLMLT